MRQKKPDRRVQRTRRSLHKALMSCILEKRYESITVQEVLDRADVGTVRRILRLRAEGASLSACGLEQFYRISRRIIQQNFRSAWPGYDVIAEVQVVFSEPGDLRM